MKEQDITIKDIARHFGVSVSTVSRALKDAPGISLERRQAIQQYAKEHRYQPNEVATNLRKNRGANIPLIGVIIPQFTHYFFSCVLSGIEEASSQAGYRIIVAQSNDDYEREKKILQSFRQSRVSGILLSQAKGTTHYEHYEEILEDGIPMVFYDRICTGVLTSRVVIDDYQAGFTATSYLIRTGCKRIAFCGTDPSLEISKNRLNGYKDALFRHGLTVDPSLILLCDNREQAEEQIPRLIEGDNRPDGFFTVNDETALGVLYTCKHMGVQVPQEVQICGFTNGVTARSCDPQLTTMEQRGNEVGRMAVQSLLDQLSGKLPEGKFANSIVKTRLVVRGTTR